MSRMVRAAAWAWWGIQWCWWAVGWVRCKFWTVWYFAHWDLDARWRQPRLHRRMWRHYQRTGRVMVTDR